MVRCFYLFFKQYLVLLKLMWKEISKIVISGFPNILIKSKRCADKFVQKVPTIPVWIWIPFNTHHYHFENTHLLYNLNLNNNMVDLKIFYFSLNFVWLVTFFSYKIPECYLECLRQKKNKKKLRKINFVHWIFISCRKYDIKLCKLSLFVYLSFFGWSRKNWYNYPWYILRSSHDIILLHNFM